MLQMIPTRRLFVLTSLFCASMAGAQTEASAPYVAPPSSASVLQGVHFDSARVIVPDWTKKFQDCDQQSGPGGCIADPNHNTVVLQFPDGAVFFDGKMAIDADGSALSKRGEFPNQPETALRYPTTNGSLDAERVPYVVLPVGGFTRLAGVGKGDLAVVVKGGELRYAIVGDVGPATHIGEGSMKLHMNFGRALCEKYDVKGNCSHFLDTSMDAPVLYFVFPNTKILMGDVTPENINERIAAVGLQVWKAFVSGQGEHGKGRG